MEPNIKKTAENSSTYMPMYTHGFIFGYLKGINNKRLKKIAIENYKRRMHPDKNSARFEDIIIPLDKEIKKLEEKMSDVYEKHFSKKLKIVPPDKTNNYWAQVHYENESSQFHTHLHSSIDMVGVYYVSVPKNSGDLILKYKKHEFDASRWSFPPEPNKFIMFEPGLEHGVAPNKSKQPRVSISINFKIIERIVL
jgi:hypothetical protein